MTPSPADSTLHTVASLLLRRPRAQGGSAEAPPGLGARRPVLGALAPLSHLGAGPRPGPGSRAAPHAGPLTPGRPISRRPVLALHYLEGEAAEGPPLNSGIQAAPSRDRCGTSGPGGQGGEARGQEPAEARPRAASTAGGPGRGGGQSALKKPKGADRASHDGEPRPRRQEACGLPGKAPWRSGLSR